MPTDKHRRVDRERIVVPDRREAEPPEAVARGTRDDVSAQAAKAVHDAAPTTWDSENHVAVAVHDARTSLTIIALEVETLREQRDQPTVESMERALDRIARNVVYVDRLLGDLSIVVASTAAREGAVPVELSQLLCDTLDRAIAAGDRTRIHLEILANVPVRVDDLGIERVISNLIANALRHAPAGTPIHVQLELRDARGRVSITDAGPGMTSEHARTAFDRSWRGPNGGQQGLGLYICRRIIEAHGGRIGVVTSPGRGATFFFEIPLATAPSG